MGIFLKTSDYNNVYYCFIFVTLSARNVANLGTVVNLRVKGPKTPPAPELTAYQKEVIFGSMLGDLTAERTQITGNTRLRFYMSLKNKELIYHLYSIFQSYVKTEPKIYERGLNKLTKALHIDIGFSTLKYLIFNWVYEEFYVKINNKNIKIVPKNSFDRLTAVSLAFWIMDDGSFNKSKGYLILCTDSYSREDVLYLISILETKFNLSCGLIEYKKDKAYRIRINKSSLPHLISLIRPHIIPSMLYKIGL